MKTCKVADCGEPRLRGAWLCAGHLGEGRQCEKVKSNGEQCQNNARRGTTLCASHSGPRVELAAMKAKALTRMQQFTTPYSGELDPLSAFEGEFRRTYGRILWLENEISQLEDDELIWGRTEEQVTDAGEFPGTTVTYAARIHQYEEMLRWERTHFLALEKLWIGAKLDSAKLARTQESAKRTFRKVTEMVAALGLELESPEVREALKTVFFHPDSADRSDEIDQNMPEMAQNGRL